MSFKKEHVCKDFSVCVSRVEHDRFLRNFLYNGTRCTDRLKLARAVYSYTFYQPIYDRMHESRDGWGGATARPHLGVFRDGPED
jgi:hypothetical protein